MYNDLRYAFRILRKSPGFTVVAVFTLAMGIGGITTVFRVVNAAFFKPVPARDLDRLVVVTEDMPKINLRKVPMSLLQVEDLSRRTDLFQTLAAYRSRSLNLTGLGDPQQLAAVETVGEFFKLFDVQPVAGSFYRAEDADSRQAVLSYELWQQLGGDRAIIGKPIDLNGVPYQVVGIMRASFRFPRGVQVFIPFYDPSLRQPNRRSTLIMTTIVRLKPGLALQQLQSLLDIEVDSWPEGQGNDPIAGGFRLVPVPLAEHLSGQLRPILKALAGAVVFVLLIVCANVANLQLVRIIGRWRELAVRAALGATFARIARECLSESFLLAAAGCALGALLGEALLDTLSSLDPSYARLLDNAAFDKTVFAFTAAVAVAAGIVSSLAAALRAIQANTSQLIKGPSCGQTAPGSKHRLLEGFAAAQIGLALVLLIGAVLMIRSLGHLLATDPGFQTDNILSFRLNLPPTRYPNPAAAAKFFGDLEDQLRTVPGVQSVGLTTALPFTTTGTNSPFRIIGREPAPGEPARHANYHIVTADYFRTMGIQLLRGRLFNEHDHPLAPGVCIIDEKLANEFFRGEDPLGRTIFQGPTLEVVGVVAAIRYRELGGSPYPTVYHAFSRQPPASTSVVIRSGLDPGNLTRLVRQAVAGVDRELPMSDIRTMRQVVMQSVGARRLATALFGGFGALAVALALLGIYGVLSNVMRQRTQEIGIRLALGAAPGDILAMALRRGVRLASFGLGFGLLLALWVCRFLESELYVVAARDPVTWAGCCIALAAVAIATCWIPARRAARVDPMVALRCE